MHKLDLEKRYETIPFLLYLSIKEAMASYLDANGVFTLVLHHTVEIYLFTLDTLMYLHIPP